VFHIARRHPLEPRTSWRPSTAAAQETYAKVSLPWRQRHFTFPAVNVKSASTRLRSLMARRIQPRNRLRHPADRPPSRCHRMQMECRRLRNRQPAEIPRVLQGRPQPRDGRKCHQALHPPRQRSENRFRSHQPTPANHLGTAITIRRSTAASSSNLRSPSVNSPTSPSPARRSTASVLGSDLGAIEDLSACAWDEP
jgi:hypothetical protein